MTDKSELYFKNDTEWRNWLHENHGASEGIYLIFYKLEHKNDSMRWEEAVRVAICYGWIDSTVKSLGNGKRRQYFCPRRPKSVWSKLNKTYIVELISKGLMHESGLKVIDRAKKDGSWTALDDVENGVIPQGLQKAFDQNSKAFENYQNFTRGQRKSYLYWLNNAKREDTRKKRIKEIVRLCASNIKGMSNR
ncbi:MAG: YdeI/OmpD-associated family protein [Saonia sp.]